MKLKIITCLLKKLIYLLKTLTSHVRLNHKFQDGISLRVCLFDFSPSRITFTNLKSEKLSF